MEKDKNEAMPVHESQRVEKMKGLIKEAAGLVDSKKEEAFIVLFDMDGKQIISLVGKTFSLAATIAQAMDSSPDFYNIVRLALFARQAKELGIHGEKHSGEAKEEHEA